MLRVLTLSNGFVERFGPIPTAYSDRNPEVIAHRLKYVLCYGAKIVDLPVFRDVWDTEATRCV